VRFNARRIGAITRKELREYRRNRSLLVAVSILPLIFLIQPLILVFKLPSATALEISNRHLLLYMLVIPVLAPSVLAAYSVAGERQQGTLEPILTTPIRAAEFLLGKALAAFLPSVAISYLLFAVFIGLVLLFAPSGIASALLRPSDIGAQVVFTPMLATGSIWISVAVSTRLSDPRVAQQLSLASVLPLAVVPALIAFDVIPGSRALTLGLGALLLVVDVLGWRLVSPLFNREQLVSG